MEHNLKLDISFSDYLRKKATKNRAGGHCYVYLPADWDGHEVVVLKLGRVERREEPPIDKKEEVKKEVKKEDHMESDILKEVGL